MFKHVWILSLLLVVMWGNHAAAEDVYCHLDLGDLELTEGRLPITDEANWSTWWCARNRPAYAVLDGDGEVYVTYLFNTRNAGQRSEAGVERQIAIRVSKPRDVTGQLYLPDWDQKGMEVARFKVPASRFQLDERSKYFELKLAHYEDLLSRNVPGAAWFRHEARQARAALGKKATDLLEGQQFNVRRRTDDLTDTCAMFTGGRAMSENLQLDRVLRPAQEGEETVEVDSIEGITVREIDWRPLVKDLQPELDPLAHKIPADQHAVFFPSFNAAVAMSDEMAEQGTPILQLAEPRSTSARTFERYQRQMCLTITQIARLLGPAVAQSVAVTGSDPYFRTGTDMAVLFEAAEPAVLENLLLAQVSLAAAENPDAQPMKGEVHGLAYRGARSEDRSICCYIAKTDGLVIVTNSPIQLERLADVIAGKSNSIASLDEYVFFRDRYRRGDEGETAFLFLSDATIRRWCDPRWRIATSRRVRDAAVLAEIQASQLDRLVQGNVQTGPIYTDLTVVGDGQLTLQSDGVRCTTTGSLAFMTPISEMEMNRVTKAEADAYRQWRDRYQSNWRWAFDPIGLRVGISDQQLSADLTVMPLIWASDYRTMISYSRGAEFPPDSGDQHDTLAHLNMAINTKSESLRQQTSIFRTMTGNVQLDPLSWLGDSVGFYVDEDDFWKEIAQVSADDLEDFMEKEGWRIPLAVRADVSSGLKLTAFLAGVRGFIEQASPGMLNWEPSTYKDQPYVKVTPTERAIGRTEQIRNLAVYYCASGTSLTLTLNEDVLKRAIDREVVRSKAKKEGKEKPVPAHPWIGSNLALQVEQRILHVLAVLGRDRYQTAMQTLAWGNLPILNEWKQRYPDQNPVSLHEKFWQDRLLCPGGGEFVWNEQWQTMESTVYGCPGAPKMDPRPLPCSTMCDTPTSDSRLRTRGSEPASCWIGEILHTNSSAFGGPRPGWSWTSVVQSSRPNPNVSA